MIQIKDAKHFFEIQKQIKKIPFSQSEGWFNSEVQRNQSIVFFVDNEKDVKIAVWGREQSIPLSKKKLLLINGEAILDNISEKTIIEFYSLLKEENYKGIEINSDNEFSIDFEIGIRRAGFIRPIGFFACPLTINFQFQKDFSFSRSWKRNVKKAISSELIFEEIKIVNTEDIQAIISMFKEMAELKNLGYQLEEKNLTDLLNSPDMRLFMVYDKQHNPVAARIVHDNKPFSSDVYAANALTARDNGATYFMMQRIFEKLKNEEYMEFDFGRIPPSNHATDSVYLFKNASRGDRIQYNGEWCFYKSKYIELLMFLYKNFKLNKQRY